MWNDIMVSHQRLQHYRRNYGMVCVTGTLGCRWHRYKQSTWDSTKGDLAWFSLLVVTLLFMLGWFYFWLIAQNDKDDIDWFVYEELGVWYSWYTVIFALTCTVVAYLLILMILALCHVGHGHQLYMHTVHRVMLVLIVLCGIGSIVLVELCYHQGWKLIELSFMMTGPFLHIAAVIIMTGMTWFIAGQWIQLYKLVPKVLLLLLYVAVMLALYIVPILIYSPCITDSHILLPGPKMFAHSGARAVAPENTLMAFEYAADQGAYGFETDVSISWDGVPFIMHDTSLKRTTNVEEVFPKYADYLPSRFNMSQLQQLDAGSWFLQKDPFGTASSLTAEQVRQVRNQTVPTLFEVASLARKRNKTIIFDIQSYGVPKGHPYRNAIVNLTIEAILKAGIPPENVYFMYTSNVTRQWAKFKPVGRPEWGKHFFYINAWYSDLSWQDIKNYKEKNVSTNIYTVNMPWFYSLYWCMGLSSVTTDQCQVLNGMQAPVWQLSPQTYTIMWVTTDVVSAVLVIIIFVVHKVKQSGKTFNPETISLQAARTRMNQHKQNRNMKEKLLFTAEGIHEAEPGIVGMSPTDQPEIIGIDEIINNQTPRSHGSINSSVMDGRTSANGSVKDSHSARNSSIIERHSVNGSVGDRNSMTHSIATTDASASSPPISDQEMQEINLSEIKVDFTG